MFVYLYLFLNCISRCPVWYQPGLYFTFNCIPVLSVTPIISVVFVCVYVFVFIFVSQLYFSVPSVLPAISFVASSKDVAGRATAHRARRKLWPSQFIFYFYFFWFFFNYILHTMRCDPRNYFLFSFKLWPSELFSFLLLFIII